MGVATPICASSVRAPFLDLKPNYCSIIHLGEQAISLQEASLQDGSLQDLPLYKSSPIDACLGVLNDCKALSFTLVKRKMLLFKLFTYFYLFLLLNGL